MLPSTDAGAQEITYVIYAPGNFPQPMTPLPPMMMMPMPFVYLQPAYAYYPPPQCMPPLLPDLRSMPPPKGVPGEFMFADEDVHVMCFHCGEQGHKASRCSANPNLRMGACTQCAIHGKFRTAINLRFHQGKMVCLKSNPCLSKGTARPARPPGSPFTLQPDGGDSNLPDLTGT